MSDMSFKQAKEIVERLELTELSLKHLIQNAEKTSQKFEDSLQKQHKIMNLVPTTNKKITFVIFIVGINIGFIIGLLVSKFFLS